jgi:hypothetical protein
MVMEGWWDLPGVRDATRRENIISRRHLTVSDKCPLWPETGTNVWLLPEQDKISAVIPVAGSA